MGDSDIWRGDRGLTDLIDRQDIPKFDLRIEVLGTIDEASSAIGVARAGPARSGTKSLLLDVQRDLCWMMSELALASQSPQESSHITSERLAFLTTEFNRVTAEAELGNAFILPGDTRVSASLHLARSIVRRAERHLTRLDLEAGPLNPTLIAYLNRLSALLYVLARAEDIAAGIPSTQAHPSSNGTHANAGS